MKVLLVAIHHLVPDSTGSLRSRAMAKYLPRSGVEVDVLTYRAQRERVTVDGNVIGVRDITRESAPMPVYVAWRLWQKGLRVLGVHRDVQEHWRDLVLRSGAEILERSRPDAILATYPSVEALQVGVGLSRMSGLPLISDFRDGLLFEPLEVHRLGRRATRRRYEALEAEVIERSCMVLTVSDPISAYFRDRYHHPDVFTQCNGFDPEDVAPDTSVELEAGPVHLVHTGRLGESRAGTSGKGNGVAVLRSAVELLLERSPATAERLRIQFVGQLSAAEQEVLGPLAERGIACLWGHQPRARALGFQAKADVLLLITVPDQASIVTGKLFEYLAARKPILALTRGTEAGRIVRDTGAGLVVAPDDPEPIARALEQCIATGGKLPIRRDDEQVAAFSRSRQMASLAERLTAKGGPVRPRPPSRPAGAPSGTSS